jgi:hypothetical protein
MFVPEHSYYPFINTIFTAKTHDCMEKVRPGPVERLAWAMQEVEHRMEQLPKERREIL